MVAHYHQGWEPWEARRARAPRGLPAEVKEARQDAKLLLLVVRTRLAAGQVPLEHVDRLAAVAQDERLPPRRRRMAAQYLARMRMEAMRSVREPGTDGRQARARRVRS